MTLKINETRFHEMTQSPTGAVGQHLAMTGAKVESAAKALATTEGLVRTGRYRASITGRLTTDGGNLAVKVGSAVPHAKILENGSLPHQILPRRPAYALMWEQKPNVGGRGWFVPDHPLPFVQHPGTRPYRILHRAVASVLRKGGQP